MTQETSSELFRLELRISHFLRYGVLVSLLFLGGGWLAQIVQSQDRLTHFQVYQPTPLIQMLESALMHGDYAFLSISFGLAVLISLPIIRVLLTGILFVKNQDWILAGLAFFVFSVLCLSFFLGAEL